MAIIEIADLTKDYSHGRGVFHVSFEVKEGECVGFLGPNGAGKSTTIRHLMGFAKPDSGSAMLFGKEARKERGVLEKVGYIPGEVSLPKNLTGREFLSIQLSLRRRKADTIAELSDLFRIDLDERTRDMSLGTKRKVAILAALLSSPEVYILDEPSSGLDPSMQSLFLDIIQKEKEKGRTMLFSSHVFSEVERVSDRIVVIKDGKIAATIPKEVIARGGQVRYELSFSSLESFHSAQNRKEYCPLFVDEERRLLFYSPENGRIADFLAFVSSLPVDNFHARRETLREIFLSYYQEDKEYTGL